MFVDVIWSRDRENPNESCRLILMGMESDEFITGLGLLDSGVGVRTWIITIRGFFEFW